eukprot:TRINITY_DN22899_c0_g1_i1.p1 TRINITY_DN22899_c0_g1~~TRINITY_DN22899_c0_g1_i1.p1  ORF type:complete len:470 (+),score=120.47 TRINITY_DN22899_c0_g1_i1:69-1478(+)
MAGGEEAAVPLPIVYVLGATGTGKSELALEAARWLRAERGLEAEVINVDAMQMYRGLPVATNHASEAEQREVPHHLLACFDPAPGKEVAVGDFAKRVASLVPEILGRGRVPVLCGGSNYYVQAAMFAETLVDEAPAAEEKPEQEQGQEQGQEADRHDCEDAEALHRRLAEVDPVMAAKYHPRDVRRVRRSLEVYEETGEAHSAIIARQVPDTLRFTPAARNIALWVDCDRGTLYGRLDKRVDSMAARGVETEVRTFCERYAAAHGAINAAAPPTRGIFGAIGFKELVPGVLNGAAMGDGYAAMKQNTRRYAKQQVQWIRNRFCSRDGVTVYRVDSSSKQRFREVAVAAATGVLAAYLDGKDPAALFPKLVAKVEKGSRERHECPVCPGVVLFGADQVRGHNKSRKHKAAFKRKAAAPEVDAQKAKRRKLDPALAAAAAAEGEPPADLAEPSESSAAATGIQAAPTAEQQ